MRNHEVLENVVASFVDIASMMVAYMAGLHQFSFFAGLAYAFFDAVLVVWMRKPLTRLIRSAFQMRNRRFSIADAYVADL